MSDNGKAIILFARDFEKMGDPVLLRVWVWCLKRMARQRMRQTVRSGRATKQVQVLAGQFAYQRGAAAEALGMEASTVRDTMKRLYRLGKVMCAASPDKQWTLVTVVEHQRYLPAKKKRTTTKGSALFEEFWALWPTHVRKASKAKCYERWRKDRLDKRGDHILAVLRRLKGSEKWKEANGQYVPAPLVWLNQQRWDRKLEDMPSTVTDRMEIQMRFQTELSQEEQYAWFDKYHGDRQAAMFAWNRERMKKDKSQ